MRTITKVGIGVGVFVAVVVVAIATHNGSHVGAVWRNLDRGLFEEW